MNCYREHRCIKCGSKDHKISDCETIIVLDEDQEEDPEINVQNLTQKQIRKACMQFNNEPISTHDKSNCNKNHVCLRCGISDHPAMICFYNANEYDMKTGLE